MIPRGVEIFIGLEPIDLRWGFDRLAGAVEERMERKCRSGALFVFFGKRRSTIKVFFFDGSGLCLFYKRLDKGTFRPIDGPEGHRAIKVEERFLDDLLDAVDVERRSNNGGVRKNRVH